MSSNNFGANGLNEFSGSIMSYYTMGSVAIHMDSANKGKIVGLLPHPTGKVDAVTAEFELDANHNITNSKIKYRFGRDMTDMCPSLLDVDISGIASAGKISGNWKIVDQTGFNDNSLPSRILLIGGTFVATQ